MKRRMSFVVCMLLMLALATGAAAEGVADGTYQGEGQGKGGDNENDPALVRVVAENALDAATWLRDEVSVMFEDYMLFFGGHSVKRSLVPKNASGVELISKLTAKAEAVGVEIHKNTPAVELVMDNGRVSAVKAQYGDQEILYTAGKGVVLATGGFGSNLEMRKANNPAMEMRRFSPRTLWAAPATAS